MWVVSCWMYTHVGCRWRSTCGLSLAVCVCIYVVCVGVACLLLHMGIYESASDYFWLLDISNVLYILLLCFLLTNSIHNLLYIPLNILGFLFSKGGSAWCVGVETMGGSRGRRRA